MTWDNDSALHEVCAILGVDPAREQAHSTMLGAARIAMMSQRELPALQAELKRERDLRHAAEHRLAIALDLLSQAEVRRPGLRSMLRGALAGAVGAWLSPGSGRDGRPGSGTPTAEVRLAVLVDERGNTAGITARQDHRDATGLLYEEFGAVHDRYHDDEDSPVFRQVEVVAEVPLPVVDRTPTRVQGRTGG